VAIGYLLPINTVLLRGHRLQCLGSGNLASFQRSPGRFGFMMNETITFRANASVNVR
jgi:hypothetical protein